MANQFRIPSYVKPGRVEAPDNDYPADPVAYVTKKKVANRPFGTEKWTEEETFSATLTRKQAEELESDTPWIKHHLTQPKESNEFSERQEKINFETRQYAQWLWTLQSTNKPLFKEKLRDAPLAVKKILVRLGFAPSKYELQQANRVVGESALAGNWTVINENRQTKYSSTQAHTNALLTQQQKGVTTRQLELMDQDKKQDPNSSGMFGRLREERIAELDGESSYRAGTEKYITRNRLIHKNLPRKTTLLQAPSTVPINLLTEFHVLMKRSQEAKLRDVMGPGAASLVQENFTRLAQTQCYTLRVLQDTLNLTRQLLEQKRRPTALTPEQAQMEVFLDEKAYKAFWVAYGFLGEKAELAVTQVAMHTVKHKTSEKHCLEMTSELEYEWPLNKAQSERKQQVNQRVGAWRVPEEQKGKLGSTPVMVAQANQLTAKFMEKYKPYAKKKPETEQQQNPNLNKQKKS